MSGTVGAHNELHSEQGALPGEHTGRARNPVIKVADIAWLEFEKPDLDRAEAFARAFGFTTVAAHPRRTAAARHRRRRAVRAAAPRQRGRVSSGPHSRPSTRSTCCGWPKPPERRRNHCPSPSAGISVELTDPSGLPVRVVAGMHELAELAPQQPHVFNVGHGLQPYQRHAAPTPGTRQACNASATWYCRRRNTRRHLNFYLDNLGMIVSDFLFYRGQREPAGR